MKRAALASAGLMVLLAWGAAAPPPCPPPQGAKVLLAEDSKLQVGFNPLPAQTDLARYGLTRAWFTQVAVDSLRDNVSGLTLDDGRLYVQTSRGTVEALDTVTGSRAWLTQVGRPDLANFAPAANEQTLFVINGSRLYALDKATGRMQWDVGIPTAAATRPSASQSNVFVSLVDGRLWGYSLNAPEDRPPFLRGWYYATSQPIEVPALAYGDVVCFANDAGSLFVVDADDHNLVYQYETDAPIAAPLALYVQPPAGEASDPRPIVVMASRDQFVYGIDLMSGLNLWQFTAGRETLTAPVVVGHELYLTPVLSGLHRLDPVTGEEQWRCPGVARFVAASPRRVYGVDVQRRLMIINRESGELLAVHDLRQFDMQVLNAEDDRIYLATRNGLIVCLRELELELPVAHSPEEQPILPPVEPESAEEDAAR